VGIFDFFRSKPAPKQAPRSFVGLCYDMAYFVLPPIAHGDIAQVHQLWTESATFAGGFLFFSAGQRQGMNMSALEDGSRFISHHGKLDASRTYYVLEFPAPPPFASENIPAPHFTAIVYDSAKQQTEYFILGQSPGGGTNLRSVNALSMNMNLGPGPTPTLDRFLDALRTQ
jgi:hypothetical protein